MKKIFKNKKIVSTVFVIAWMIIIFVMSSYNSVDSSNQSNVIVDVIVNIFNITSVNIISVIVRKLAHFSEYLILGILVANMIKYYDKKHLIGVTICILYAISDEIHQLFVPGRSCQILDIVIDTIGSCIGLAVLSIFSKK